MARLVLIVLVVLLGHMSLLGDIADALSGAVGGVVDAVKAVWKAIKAVFTFFAHLADLVGDAWDWMVNGVSWLAHNIVEAGVDAYHFIGWILFHGIPDAVSWVWKQAWNLAARALKHAINWARDAVNAATRFLHGLIHTVAQWAKDAVKWLTGLIGKLLHWVHVAGDWLWNVVSHPDRLARWILAPFAKLMVREWAFFARLFAGLFPGLVGRVATAMVGAIEEWLLKVL